MGTIKNAYDTLENLLVTLHRITKMLGTTIKITLLFPVALQLSAGYGLLVHEVS
jgi:hypothetical protein